MLELEENRRLFLMARDQEALSLPQPDWGQILAGAGVLCLGLAMMVLAQRSVFKRTLVEKQEVLLRLRFVERRGGVA